MGLWWRMALCALAMQPVVVGTAPLAHLAAALGAQEAPAGRIGENVVVETWPMTRYEVGFATIYAQPEVSVEVVGRYAAGIEFLSARLPAVLDIPPVERYEYFLLKDATWLLAGVQTLGRSPMPFSTMSGVAVAGGPRPGVYIDAGSRASVEEQMWTLAHEMAHLVAHQSAAGREFPAWFNEGVAETVAAVLMRERYAAHVASQDFLARARVASAAHTGKLPVLAQVAVDEQWWQAATAENHDVLYGTAWLFVEHLATPHGPPALGRTLRAIGDGQSFDEAAGRELRLTSERADEGLRAFVTESLLPAFPTGVVADQTSLPATGRVTLVAVGYAPADWVTWRYTGPNRCRAESRSRVSAAGFGLVAFELHDGTRDPCAGNWQVEVVGDQGARGRTTFTFIR